MLALPGRPGLFLARNSAVWNVTAVMRTPLASCALALMVLSWNTPIHAQSAVQLTRKVVPPASKPANPPAAQPAKPAPAVPPTSGYTPGAVPAPPPPADAEKAKQETVKKTVEFQTKRATEGSASAQYELGLRYLKGDGVEVNEKTGRKWLEESAKNNYTLAKRKLEELDAPKK